MEGGPTLIESWRSSDGTLWSVFEDDRKWRRDESERGGGRRLNSLLCWFSIWENKEEKKRRRKLFQLC